eukprot:849137-Alexandrium_andersonii.AAC.1
MKATVIETPRGLTADPDEFDKAVRGSWGAVYSGNLEDPWRSARQFIRDYRPFIFAAQEHAVEPLTLEKVKASFVEAPDTAPGFDGWCAQDFRHAPDCVFRWLVAFFTQIEAGMTWPSAMTHARAIMLPKTERLQVDPLAFRLLSISSFIYRRWAALRLLDM